MLSNQQTQQDILFLLHHKQYQLSALLEKSPLVASSILSSLYYHCHHYAASISVSQHVELSEQIHRWDPLACCWGIKQSTNMHHYDQCSLHMDTLTRHTNFSFHPRERNKTLPSKVFPFQGMPDWQRLCLLSILFVCEQLQQTIHHS